MQIDETQPKTQFKDRHFIFWKLKKQKKGRHDKSNQMRAFIVPVLSALFNPPSHSNHTVQIKIHFIHISPTALYDIRCKGPSNVKHINAVPPLQSLMPAYRLMHKA